MVQQFRCDGHPAEHLADELPQHRDLGFQERRGAHHHRHDADPAERDLCQELRTDRRFLPAIRRAAPHRGPRPLAHGRLQPGVQLLPRQLYTGAGRPERRYRRAERRHDPFEDHGHLDRQRCALVLRPCQLRLSGALYLRGQFPGRRFLAFRQGQPLGLFPLVFGGLAHLRGAFSERCRGRLARQPQGPRLVGTAG